MKKILLAVAMVLVYNSAMACRTQTIIVGGQMMVCTICPTITTCN